MPEPGNGSIGLLFTYTDFKMGYIYLIGFIVLLHEL